MIKMSNVKVPKNLEKFNKEEIHEWINSFDVVLTDCDGEKNLKCFGLSKVRGVFYW
jgi:hypothetical protein